MEMEETALETPSDFPFPFTPYSIQKDLMRNLYNALEGKKLGIFESPTGTVSKLKFHSNYFITIGICHL